MYVFLIVTIFIVYCVHTVYRNNVMKKLVERLNSSGWRLYLNGNNCGFCTRQIAFFSTHFSEVTKTHCDDGENKKKCEKYAALPTWVNDKSGEESIGAKLSHKAFEKMLA